MYFAEVFQYYISFYNFQQSAQFKHSVQVFVECVFRLLNIVFYFTNVT